MTSPRSSRVARWLAGAARAVGSALWPGLSADGESAGWDAVALGGPALARRVWRRLPWLAGLYALVVVIAAAGGVINSSHRGNGGVAFLLLLPCVGGLALAARRPRDGWRVVTLCLLVTPFLLAPPAGPVPPLEAWQWCLWVPTLLLVGMAGRGRVVAAVGVVSVLVLVALTLLTPWPVDPGYLTLSVVGVAVALVVGASVGTGATSRRALAEEQARVAAALAEQGALAERARIAREMHDVVAHHMSMIAVRCETAPYRLPDLSRTGQAEIAEIAAAARAAMADMQRLLGVLRAEVAPQPSLGARAELAPQPSLADLPGLVEQARASGLRLHASLDGDLGSVPAQLGLSAYRIAQEALTNAGRHAPGAPVTLRLCRAGGVVELWVRTAPTGSGSTHRASAGGHGLTGMLERATLHGGELSAGPDADGGFTVRARLPLPDDIASTGETG